MSESITSINDCSKNWADKNKIVVSFNEQMDSTNNEARRDFIKSGQPIKIYLADHQTQGRGRNKSIWADTKKGGSLLSTWCFHKTSPMQPIFAPLIGLSLYNSLRNTWPKLNLSMKAPNDIYLDDGKLAGILIESAVLGEDSYLLIGIGINVLDKPELEGQSTEQLSSQIDISEKSWHFFCSQLFQLLKDSLEHGQEETITTQKCVELANALNAYPGLTEKLNEVGADGSLIFPSKTISWWNL